MELSFGESLSDVRVHADARAATLADAVSARAFAVGSDVMSAAGGPHQHGEPARAGNVGGAMSIARVVGPDADERREGSNDGRTGEPMVLSVSPAAQAVMSATDTALGIRVGMDPFIASLLDPKSPQNPAPLKKDKSADVKAVAGTAFGTSPAVSPADVSQGALGDCYLLAMMIAIARVRPDVLEKLIKDNGDGTYDVTLYEDHIIGGATPFTEKVTAEVPVDKTGNPLYAQINPRANGGRPLWPLLIEKAFAKHKGSYSDIEGLEATEAAQALSQTGGVKRSTGDFDTAAIADKIDAGLSKGMAMTATTIQRRIDDIRDWLQKKAGIPTTDVSEAEKKWNIMAPHEYIVKSVDKKAMTIDLINPWGHDHLTGLPLDVFMVAFRCWTEVDLSPAPVPSTPAKP